MKYVYSIHYIYNISLSSKYNIVLNNATALTDEEAPIPKRTKKNVSMHTYDHEKEQILKLLLKGLKPSHIRKSFDFKIVL
jgi:hypothetical protein